MFSIFNTIATLMTVMFIAYVLFILVPFLRRKPIESGVPDQFETHFFVPCRDEEFVVSTTIRRARRDFPDAHVWVIDDDSDDATSAVAHFFAREDPFVHVVQRRRPQARTGKGDALNAAYAQLDDWLPDDVDRERIIIAVIDADGELAPNALHVVASETVFGNPAVGAAQTAVWMKNRADKKPFPERGRIVNWFSSFLLRMQDLEFRTIIAGMQSLREKTGTVGLGGNGQFTRLTVLDAIREQYGEPWHGALLEDYELGVHVLLAGYEIRSVYDTHVSQEALPDARRLITQRTRWAQGNIQCVKYIKDVVASPKFDAGGVIETCYYLVLPFLQLLGVIAVGSVLGIRIWGAVTDPGSVATDPKTILGLIGLMITFTVLPFAVWGPVYRARCEPQALPVMGIVWGIGTWLYMLYMYVVIVRAFARVLTGKNGWAKTRRNAEAHVAGAIAIEA